MSTQMSHRRNTQGMRTLLTAMFPPLAAVPAGRGRAVAVKARKPVTPRKAQAPRSRLQQALCHSLLALALGSGLTGALIAYNFRDAIEAQATQWVMALRG